MSSQRAGHSRLVTAWRWPVHLLLALLVIAQVLTCHAVVTESALTSATISSQRDIGHESCQPGFAVAAPAVRSTTRECSVPFRLADLVAVIALMALLGGVAFTNGSPRWAPREVVGGRQLLTRLQVIRV